jgi:hypothetical protein
MSGRMFLSRPNIGELEESYVLEAMRPGLGCARRTESVSNMPSGEAQLFAGRRLAAVNDEILYSHWAARS